MIGAIIFFNNRGDVLLVRSYVYNEINRSVADAFRINIIHSRQVIRSPIIIVDNITYFHLHLGTVWIVLVTRKNMNACFALEILNSINDVLVSFFGNINDEVIKSNFTTIYCLLDEMIDYGYPFVTESVVLKEFFTGENIKLQTKEEVESKSMQATGAVSWRKEGIKHRRNEIYIDVIERINTLMSSQGTELSADVDGSIIIRSALSGMPECRLGLNNKLKVGACPNSLDSSDSSRKKVNSVDVVDFQFHRCVKLDKGNVTSGISFIPPDGEFELVKYRATKSVKLPFKVIPIVREVGSSRLEIKVIVRSLYIQQIMGFNVCLKIPLPANTANVVVKTLSGKAKYKGGENAILWRMIHFGGNSECTLSASVDLMATTEKQRIVARPPITMQFTVPVFSSSGLLINFLKVIESRLNYVPIRAIRYVVHAGKFDIRM